MRNLFRLKLFGSASIEGPDGPVTGRPVQRRRLGLLALLAIARDRGVTRDKLMAYLWPDADPERARHLLSDSVYRINQAVGGDALIAVGTELRLNPEKLPSDVWEFAEALARRDWRRAVELHVAPFLDGFFLTDADELERWVEGQRERLARERARALEALATEAEESDALADAVHWWQLLAAQDPYSSRIALRLMQALDRSGDRAAALRHARVHTVMLQEELGVTPDAELLAFADELTTPSPLPAWTGPDPSTRSSPADPSRPAAPAGGPSEPAAHPESSGDTDTAPEPHRGAAGAAGEPAPAPITAIATSAGPTSAPPAQHRTSRREAKLRPAAIAILGLLALAAAWRFAVARDDPATPAAPPSIAVLPFADLSESREYEYFADGITEELIARLALIDGLSVVGRTSAFAFKGQAGDVRDIAARLNVATLLEGSVRHSGDRIRIVARLTDARNGYQLWTGTYQRDAKDVFAIQDEISRQIVTHLRGQLTGAEESRLAELNAATTDPEAFNLYLRGRYNWHRRTQQSLLAAADYFSQAVERAPDYAQAHTGLGDAYAVLGFYDFLPPQEAFPAAAAAARRALELQPSLPAPHATLGYVALYYDWDWERAEREFRRAIELDPGYSTAHQWYANFLTAMGRFDEATREMGEAMALDPLSLIANAALGWVLFNAGDYERAIAQCSRALELDPAFALGWLWRGMAREQIGDLDGALTDLESAVHLSGGSAIHVAAYARALALAGQRDRATELLRELEQRTGADYVPPFEVAKVHEALGDRDAALSDLERALEHRSHSMVFLMVDPQLASLREEPRFRRLVEEVGLAAR